MIRTAIPAVHTARRAATLRQVSQPAAPNAAESIELFDDAEVEDDFWALDEAEKVNEGVFVSEPTLVPADHRPRPPSSIKHLNRLLSRHKAPDVPESDLEERFVKGRGPGGQAINKTNSCVCLTHLPTGIRVQAQPTRSREQNRAVARQILKERLDLLRARELARAGEADEVEAASRKERLANEARKWSKQELRWEKERRRKSNRAKKIKKRDRRDEDEDGVDSEGAGDVK
ncbi:hypothetical protein Q5752_003737 [Cryptotrichosporon argae]